MRALTGLLALLLVIAGLAGASVWIASKSEAEAAARVRSDVDPAPITYTIELATLQRVATAPTRIRPRVTASLPASKIQTPVVTRVDVTVGDRIAFGQSVLEVQGRPVIVLEGGFPPWRDFTSGMSAGIDVDQLQQSLAGLGLYEGPIDGILSPATKEAIQRMYSSAGYQAPSTIGDDQVVLPVSELWFVPAGEWVVNAADVEVGDLLLPGLVEIGSTDVAVSLTVPESVVPELTVGDTLTLFNAEAAFETSIRGIVSFVPGEGGDSVVTVTVASDIPEGFRLATRSLVVLASTGAPVMIVPSSAVFYDADTTYVNVVRQSGTQKTPIRLGMESEGFFEVADGDLQVGDQVVLGYDP
jgi:multidrug efflux pump subunit AcrA (membrane-fusion protein)